jgi:hypothetical protein
MKKSLILVVICCTFVFCTWQTPASNPSQIHVLHNRHSLPYGYEEIELTGTLDFIPNQNSIEAGISDNAIYIYFHQNLGYVSINIYNDFNNIIYSNVVDTSTQQTVIIPLSPTHNGTFTIVLNNANGYAEGFFERN